jgi:hypothetical protein
MLISPTASWRGMLALLFMVGLQAVQPAHAVPSYSRQTNSECAACHIGAFGPHLTPYGIRFKLGGYTDTDGKGGKIPLSMTVQLTSTETEIGNPSTRGKTDVRLSNVDIYLAGRLTENVGSTRVCRTAKAPRRPTTPSSTTLMCVSPRRASWGSAK